MSAADSSMFVQLNVHMTCLTTGPASLTRMPHNVAYQLMQLPAGAYIAILHATLSCGKGKQVCSSRHAHVQSGGQSDVIRGS